MKTYLTLSLIMIFFVGHSLASPNGSEVDLKQDSLVESIEESPEKLIAIKDILLESQLKELQLSLQANSPAPDQASDQIISEASLSKLPDDLRGLIIDLRQIRSPEEYIRRVDRAFRENPKIIDQMSGSAKKESDPLLNKGEGHDAFDSLSPEERIAAIDRLLKERSE